MAKGKGGSNDSRKLSFGKNQKIEEKLEQKKKDQKSIKDKEDNVY
jgi:hypothetical protein